MKLKQNFLVQVRVQNLSENDFQKGSLLCYYIVIQRDLYGLNEHPQNYYSLTKTVTLPIGLIKELEGYLSQVWSL